MKNNMFSDKLRHFPVSYFSVVMGLSGLSITTHRAEVLFQLPHYSFFLTLFASFCYVVISVLYLTKLVKFNSAVKNEWLNPVKMNFFPAISISLVLLSIAFLNVSKDISKILLIVGATAHIIFTLKIISAWMIHTRFNVNHKNPAWFIPVVGNILVPIPATVHFHAHFSWFFFSIGLILWLVLFTIFIYRAIFHAPLADKLLPTFFILIAPPAVAFISYMKLTSSFDSAAHLLYFFSLFTALLLFFNAKKFIKIEFFLSWWAYTFPLAALTIATQLVFEKSNLLFYKYLAITIFVFLNLLILFLSIRTFIAVKKGQICVEEKE